MNARLFWVSTFGALAFCSGGIAMGHALSLREKVVTESAPEPSGPATTCPDPTKLRGICNDVAGKIADNSKPDDWSFAYERKIYEASCVDLERDSDAVAREKIRSLWNKYQSYLKCDGGDFDVTNGSILKYAINVRTYNFVDNAMKTWAVDLNVIDASDNQTILDYVEMKRKYAAGTPLEKVLDQYVKALQIYGAKRRADLP